MGYQLSLNANPLEQHSLCSSVFLDRDKSFALLDFLPRLDNLEWSREGSHLFFLNHVVESDKLKHLDCTHPAKNYIIYLKERSWQKLVLLELVNLA